MSTQKAKFELFNRLQAPGFTYDEAASMRRIEMTLRRWSEAECNGEIERDETTGKPERVSQAWINGYSSKRHAWPIAGREAGALKRLAAIVSARNVRAVDGSNVLPYNQTDPRGCALYLVKASDLPESTDEQIERHSGKSAIASTEARLAWKLSCYYTRGLAVCA